jgi:hypothetical protein
MSSPEQSENILKVRDDHEPIGFNEDSDAEGIFKLCAETQVSWLKSDSSFGYRELRGRIEPWLTSLFQ